MMKYIFLTKSIFLLCHFPFTFSNKNFIVHVPPDAKYKGCKIPNLFLHMTLTSIFEIGDDVPVMLMYRYSPEGTYNNDGL